MPDNCTIAVIVNASGGRASREGAALRDRLVEAFRAHGAETDPQLVEGPELEAAIEAGKDADIVAVGGGDGTQGSAAQILSDTGQIMAILPLGTLNHLALALGVPADLSAAAEVAVRGEVLAIDLAEVGDTVFVNNASVGLYTKLVRSRDAQNLPKWLATIPAAWTVLRGFKARRLEIEFDGHRRAIETPLLFIGNNPYALKGPKRGQRATLVDGKLGVTAVRPKSAIALIGFALRALVGRADPDRDLVGVVETEEFVVHGKGSIDVAHDGEVTRMELPLRFRSRPGALKVKVPA